MSTKDPTIALLDDLLMSFDSNKGSDKTPTQKRSSARLDAEHGQELQSNPNTSSPWRNTESNRSDSKFKDNTSSPTPKPEIDFFSKELDSIMEDLRNSRGPKVSRQIVGQNTTRKPHRKSSAVLTELDALLASCDVAHDEVRVTEDQQEERRKIEEEQARIEDRRRKLDEEKRRREEEEEDMRRKRALEEERCKREEEEQRKKEELRKIEEQRRKKEEDEKKKHLRVLGRTPSHQQEQGILFTKANEDLAKMLKTLDDRSVTNGDELEDYINNSVAHARLVLSKSSETLQLLESQQISQIDPTQLTNALRIFIVYIHNDVNCVPFQYQTTILMEAKKLALSVQTIFNTIQLGGVGVSFEQLFLALKSNLANILKTLKNIAHEKGIETTATLRGPVTKTQETTSLSQQHTPVTRTTSKDFRSLSGNRTSMNGINYVPGNKDAESLQVLSDINCLQREISIFIPPPKGFNITTATANVASVAKGIVARLSSTVFDYLPFLENLATLHTHLQQLIAGIQLDQTTRNSLIQYINAFYSACEDFVTAIASNNHNPVAATVSNPRKNAADTLSTFLKYLHTCISNKRTMCYKCGVTITAEYVQVDPEKSCCLNCFVCVQCRTQLTSYFDEGGDLYCREHYFQFLRTKPGALVCRRCDQVILGQYMKVEDGRVWHKDCFVCAMCEKQLLGVFYDVKGQLRCANCSKNP